MIQIIISPAKKMNICETPIPECELDTYEELRKLWKCSEKLALQNTKRLCEFTPADAVTPAVLAYEGIQYQYLAPGIFSDTQWDYVNRHLNILSGFYGVLCPSDAVIPYRLEMQARLSVKGKKDLYDFWGDRLYRELTEEDHLIINLASREYSKAVEKYLTPEDRFITVEFGQLKDGKVKQKATLAKMARGEMVRFMAENNVCDPEDIKTFQALGFRYSEERSDKNKMIFLAEQDKK